MNDRFARIKAIVDRWNPTNEKDQEILNKFLQLYQELHD